jgi:hypothetical protein
VLDSICSPHFVDITLDSSTISQPHLTATNNLNDEYVLMRVELILETIVEKLIIRVKMLNLRQFIL